MRSILEKAIVHLLNENEDKAAEMFHKFTVERSRQIHESLRQGADPILEEGWDEMSEHYFTEEDLDGVEDHEEEDAAEEADHDAEEHMEEPAGEEASEEMHDEEAVEDDAEDHEDHEEEHDEESHEEHMEIEDRLEKLEDDLAKMTAEFEKMNADEQAEDEVEAQEEMADKIEDDMGDSVEECMDESEEEFSDLGESIAHELEKISLTLADGKFLDGSSVENKNKADPMFGKKADVSDAKPSSTKQASDDSFEREKAPEAKPAMKKSRARAKATDGMETVSKEGDKAALLNKDFAGK
jgi:hypothetical protein